MPFVLDRCVRGPAVTRSFVAASAIAMLAPALHAEPVKALYERAAAYKDESLQLLEPAGQHRFRLGAIHTPDEYADVGSVVPRFYLLSRMVMELSKRP